MFVFFCKLLYFCIMNQGHDIFNVSNKENKLYIYLSTSLSNCLLVFFQIYNILVYYSN